MEDRIVIDLETHHGRPVIRGTRVPVTRIIDALAGGMTNAEIVKEYEVTEPDIRAALSFAGDLIEQQEFHPLPNPWRRRGSSPTKTCRALQQIISYTREQNLCLITVESARLRVRS